MRDPWFHSLVLATLLSHAVLSGVRTLISYRVLALGGGPLEVGVVTAAFALLPLAVALRIGRAVDRGLGVATLRLGLLLSVVAVALAATSPTLAVLTAASAILGLGQMFHTVACQSLIPLWSEPGELDRRFGQLTLGVSMGQMLGFPVAGVVATIAGTTADGQVSTTPALLVMSALAVLALPFGFTFRNRDTSTRSKAEHSAAQQSVGQILRVRGMKPAIYSSLTVLCGMDLVMAYLPVLGQEHGLTVGAVTALLTARTVTSVGSRLALPALLVKVERRVLIVSATGVSALAMFALPTTGNVALLMIAMGVAGFFWGIGQPLTMAWVTSVADPHNRSAALAVRLAGNRIGQIAIPLVAGLLAGATGVGAVFFATGLLLSSSAVVSFRATAADHDH